MSGYLKKTTLLRMAYFYKMDNRKRHSKEDISNSSAQDFAFTAKSVRTCKLGRKGICSSPKAIWNGQIP